MHSSNDSINYTDIKFCIYTVTATIHECCIVHFTAIFKWVQKLNAWLFLPSYSLWDWLSILRLFLSQRSKTETDFLFTLIFPRFPSFTFVCFEIWLVHWLICVMWLARWNYYVFGLYEVGSKFYPNTTLISVIRSVFLCLYRTMLEHVDSRIW